MGFAGLDKIFYSFGKDIKAGISIAVTLNPEIINKIIDGPTLEYYSEYKRANILLSKLGKIAANYLKQNGYKAIELKPTIDIKQYADLSTPLPHKTVATRAGLGWIGKTALFISEQYGSAIRLTSILTNLDFELLQESIISSKCGDCNICVDEWPGQVTTGKKWNSEIRRNDFFDAYKCRNTA